MRPKKPIAIFAAIAITQSGQINAHLQLQTTKVKFTVEFHRCYTTSPYISGFADLFCNQQTYIFKLYVSSTHHPINVLTHRRIFLGKMRKNY
jgi:hypothetical protein